METVEIIIDLKSKFAFVIYFNKKAELQRKDKFLYLQGISSWTWPEFHVQRWAKGEPSLLSNNSLAPMYDSAKVGWANITTKLTLALATSLALPMLSLFGQLNFLLSVSLSAIAD